jgi:hypothetical protein
MSAATAAALTPGGVQKIRDSTDATGVCVQARARCDGAARV